MAQDSRPHNIKYALIAILLLSVIAASCSGVSVKPDSAMAAIGLRDASQAGDTTVIIEGCGNQPIVGYTYCRRHAGSVVNGSITLKLPPAICAQEECVEWRLYRPNGQERLGGAVARGITSVTIPWVQILGRDTVSAGDTGFWIVKVWARFVDNDGRARESEAEGEIRLRVVNSSYQPLNAVARDRNFVWVWSEGNRFYRMTSALRAYTGVE